METENKSKPENWINHSIQREFGEHKETSAFYSQFLSYEVPLANLLTKYITKPNIRFIGDLGCGNSSWLKFLAKKFPNKKYLGIDFIRKTLHLSSNRDVNLILGDISNLPLKEEKLDFIFSLGVNEHFPNPIQELKNWVNSLRVGGLLFVTVPNARRLDSLFVSILNNYVNHIRGRSGEKLSFSIYTNKIITNIYGYEERWTSKYLMELATTLNLKVIETFGFRAYTPLPGFLYLLPSTLKEVYFKLFSSFKPNVKTALTIGALYTRKN